MWLPVTLSYQELTLQNLHTRSLEIAITKIGAREAGESCRPPTRPKKFACTIKRNLNLAVLRVVHSDKTPNFLQVCISRNFERPAWAKREIANNNNSSKLNQVYIKGIPEHRDALSPAQRT